MPTFVATANNTATSASSITTSYSPALGDCVMVGVKASETNVSVSAFYDSAGLDIFGNPLNTWQNLGYLNVGGYRLEVWGCASIQAALSSFTADFSGPVPLINVQLVEYSGVTSFVNFGSAQNSGYNDLFFNGLAPSNQDEMVVFFFNEELQGMGSGSGLAGQPEYTIAPAVIRGSATAILIVEQTVITNGLLTAQVVMSTPSEGIGAIGVVFSGGLTLATPPGFANIDETQLLAGDPCRALTMAQIAENAALGMVRPEFFYGIYSNGQTVEAPISPVDGYQYQADELIYIYTPLTTFSPTGGTGTAGQGFGWPSAAGILFYCEWNIDQADEANPGQVTCTEVYHSDGNVQPTSTNDGQLVVLTVAQRAQGGLTMNIPPSVLTVETALEGQDLPVTQSLMQSLARVSKFAAVKAEVFYMGEYVDGETVLCPISDVDGYVYDYTEVAFMSSWKWTTNQDSFSTPPFATANGGNADGGWSQLNELQASISSVGLVNCQAFFYNHGVIDPSQPANGSTPFGRLKVFAFCQRAQTPRFSIPQFAGPAVANAAGGTNSTFVFKIDVPAPVIGALTIKLKAGTGPSGGFSLTKFCIKSTLAGSTAVVATTVLTFSSSDSVTVAAGGSVTTDSLSNFTVDNEHDYYIMAVTAASGDQTFLGFTPASTLSGGLDTTTPTCYAQLTGDQSGVTTIPSLSVAAGTIYLIQSILLRVTDSSAAESFNDIPITAFMPGQPLPYGTMQQLAQNVREGSRAVEFFGPTNHVNGDTIALPTSPVDGYSYKRSELAYIWNWHDTGTAAIRLFGFGASISFGGVVSTNVWHVPGGGSPTDYGNGGSEPADGSIDVIVVATRDVYSTSQTSQLPSVAQNPPSDVASMAFGGEGGFEIGS